MSSFQQKLIVELTKVRHGITSDNC